MSLFDKLRDAACTFGDIALTAVSGAFSFLDDPAKRQMLDETAEIIHDLAAFALPIVQDIAALNRAPNDEAMIAALNAQGKQPGEILDELDPIKRSGMLLGLASEMIRQRLLAAVQLTPDGIHLGTQALKSVDDVNSLAKNVLDASAQIAYTFWRVVQGE